MNIIENYPKYTLSGRMEIHPCVLQDIGPLGPLPKKEKEKGGEEEEEEEEGEKKEKE